ncbi:MAG: MGMT family protein [Patescibacteria group bacterium]
MSNFSDQVKQVVAKIPKGQVMTYSEVAKRAGSPKAARAVANLMAKNYDPAIPCHRVIRTDGSLGGYNRGGVEKKRAILQAEGAVLWK